MIRLLCRTSGLFFLFSLALGQESERLPDIEVCAEPLRFHKKIELALCINSTPNDYAIGLCWHTEPEPTIFNPFVIFNAPKEKFEHTVKELQPNTTYFFQFFKLFSDGRVTYFSAFSVATRPEIKVGAYHQGGIVAYLYKPGDSLYIEGEQHGLILAKEELGYAAWGMPGQAIDGGTSRKAGNGRKNTEAIVKQYGGASAQTSSIGNSGDLRIIHPCAALLCSNYSNDGWTDWFLPSKGDWELIFPKLDSLKTMNLSHAETYWSSSEVFFSWRLSKKKRSRPTKSQFKKAWQIQYASSSLMISSMRLKESTARVLPMRYF